MGAADMLTELGETVRMSRKGRTYAEVRAVIGPVAHSWQVEIGGAERQITAQAMLRLCELNGERPQPGDRLRKGETVYYVESVTGMGADPCVVLALAE